MTRPLAGMAMSFSSQVHMRVLQACAAEVQRAQLAIPFASKPCRKLTTSAATTDDASARKL